MRSRSLLFIYIVSMTFSCTAVKKVVQTNADIKAIKLIGQYEIPYNMVYDSTTVGGLSGIDYDAKNNLYYMICDDRSDRNPARFYTARIFFTAAGIDSVKFNGVKNMLQPNGNPYPGSKQDRYNTPDPEAMRYNPTNGKLVWSSEGERSLRAKDTVLVNPFINCISITGKYFNSYQLPSNLVMHVTEKGPRQNGVLEGMSFADDYKTLFVSVEEPLYEDGPRADLTDNNAYIRILKFDAASRNNIAQYAYKLSPVAYPANPATGFKLNGVPDILSIGNNKLLVMERSFSTGRLSCTIKIFIAGLDGATDISTMALKGASNFTPVTKKLLFNMDDLGIYIDNIEGMTFGPPLPNGHKTLLFIADNNFAIAEKAQLLLFEVEE